MSNIAMKRLFYIHSVIIFAPSIQNMIQTLGFFFTMSAFLVVRITKQSRKKRNLPRNFTLHLVNVFLERIRNVGLQHGKATEIMRNQMNCEGNGKNIEFQSLMYGYVFLEFISSLRDIESQFLEEFKVPGEVLKSSVRYYYLRHGADLSKKSRRVSLTLEEFVGILNKMGDLIEIEMNTFLISFIKEYGTPSLPELRTHLEDGITDVIARAEAEIFNACNVTSDDFLVAMKKFVDCKAVLAANDRLEAVAYNILSSYGLC